MQPKKKKSASQKASEQVDKQLSVTLTFSSKSVALAIIILGFIFFVSYINPITISSQSVGDRYRSLRSGVPHEKVQPLVPPPVHRVQPCSSQSERLVREHLGEIMAGTVHGSLDINCHLPRFVELMTQVGARHITEMGVRNAISSWAFAKYAMETTAAGSAMTYVATDITLRHEPVAALEKAMSGCPSVNFSFVEGDDLLIPIFDTDFALIDTWHTYAQLKRELDRWMPHVRHMAVLHDTVLFQYEDEGTEGHGDKPVDQSLFTGVSQEKKGLQMAIDDFLLTSEGKHWRVSEQSEVCFGFKALERKKTTD